MWAYLILFLFLGPEMSPEERAKEAEQAKYFEDLRRQGASLRDIGEEMAAKGRKEEENDGISPEKRSIEQIE